MSVFPTTSGWAVFLLLPVLTTLAFGAAVLVLRRRHRDSAAHAARLSRFLSALSRTNRMVMRTDDEGLVLSETCKICVDTGHAVLACIYVLDGTMLRRAATAGPADQILATVPDPLDTEDPAMQGTYTVRAFREGRHQLSNRYQQDPTGGRWRQVAIAHGIHAIVWLPLRRGGQVYGTLMLCADAPDFFDPPLLTLLDEMSDDISYALDNIDREAERRTAAREIAAGRDRFERLFQSVPMASAIVSLTDRCVIDVNQATCQRFGLTHAQMVGRSSNTFSRGLLEEDRELFYQRLRADGQVRNLVVRVRDLQGRVHPEVMNADVIDYLGQPCCLVTALDISDLRVAAETRRALAEAQAANQAKSEFLSRTSHELRTPLHAILGFAALLRRDAGPRLHPAELDHISHLERAGWHLLTLVDDVLALSRAEVGHIDVALEPLALAPLLQETVALHRPLAERGRIVLSLMPLAAEVAGVRADRTRVRQVLINLLSNAIKYNRPGGSASVAARSAGGQVVIEVADTGIGMTREQQARLFEPFNRLGREREGYEGTGIGLALARELVLLMGGRLEIDSEAGHGTRVRLYLPACEAPHPEVLPPNHTGALLQPEPATPVVADAEGLATVLCVEDNPINALLIEQLLALSSGLRVVTATTGAEGLARAAADPPDLVLLDLQLPDMHGLEVLRQLRAQPVHAGTPIIVLSASALPEELEAAREAGASDYWTKPLDFQRFPGDVERRLRRSTPA
ncbi:ATP-binding protein [Aquincola tertiaricarbonis]|uniref:histidine kinase n=1 Tax=Aquincola tertiaricarbonis TaxID=391953 RepID=A0ABY4SGG2_AQUTE|nr:ATP-binding protein [Aquincola tertiaricarbonis]URI11306.1 ATP-binding protein [Aquincola tertiaricarbonis]